MSFENAGQLRGAPAPKLPSLLEDGARMNERLAKLLHNIEAINDKVNGSSPRDVASAATPEPSPSTRRHLDQAHALIGAIEDEVQRIDARL